METSATSAQAGDDLQHELVDPVSQELLKANQFGVSIVESLLARQQSGTAAGLFRSSILLASKWERRSKEQCRADCSWMVCCVERPCALVLSNSPSKPTTISPHFTQAPAHLLTWKILVQHSKAKWKHRTCEQGLKLQGWFPFLFQFSIIPPRASALQRGWEFSSSHSQMPNACLPR